MPAAQLCKAPFVAAFIVISSRHLLEAIYMEKSSFLYFHKAYSIIKSLLTIINMAHILKKINIVLFLDARKHFLLSCIEFKRSLVKSCSIK